MLQKVRGWLGIGLVAGFFIAGELFNSIPLLKKGLWGVGTILAVIVGYNEVLK